IYIGDWEKDCNVLSLESEAAWLRIIFKMFTNGKQSTYKIPTKGLQNLWRCNEEKVSEIIQELIDYDICEINVDGRFVEFTSRRYKRENELSEIRKKAVSNRKDRTKYLQKTYKDSTKGVQITEIDIENESDIESDIVDENKKENKRAKKSKIDLPYDSENFKLKWDEWKNYKSKEHKFRYKTEMSEQ